MEKMTFNQTYERPLPGVLLLTSERVVLLEWDHGLHHYRIKFNVKLETYIYHPLKANLLTRIREHFYVSTGVSICKLDRSLKLVKEKYFYCQPPKKSLIPRRMVFMLASQQPSGGGGVIIDSDGINLYTSAEGDFICLDEDLNELGRVALYVEKGRKKNAHDILIKGNRAYLLDNFLEPYFVFRIDVNDPLKPMIIERLQELAVNAHLVAQWVSSNPERWYIQVAYRHMGGHGQYVETPGTDSGVRYLSRCTEIECYIDETHREGTRLIAVARADPTWAVLTDVEENHLYLARYEPDGRGNVFKKLCGIEFKPQIMRYHDEHIYCFAELQNKKVLIVLNVHEHYNQVLTTKLKHRGELYDCVIV